MPIYHLSNNAETKTPSQRRTGRALGTVVWVIVGGIFLIGTVYVIAQSAMQETADPFLKAPPITKRQAKTNGDGQPESRNSFTDRLFQTPEVPPDSPLEPALEIARMGLEKLRREVNGYNAIMVKRERLGGKLLDEEIMYVKVRHANPEKGINKAFYVRHLKPQSMVGQEAIWIENENDGKLVAHGSGLQKLITVNLDPDSWLAKRGNRYPITELGIETLLLRMIEKGERSLQHDSPCQVEYSRDIELDGNPITLITITHPEQHDDLDFHIAKIYIDDNLQLPVGYEGYLWPEEAGGEPVLIESYFYSDLEINPGLTDADFDPENPDYEY